MKVPLLDLCPQYNSLKDEILKEIAEVCESQRFILGAKVEKLEEELKSYCQSAGCVGVTSGSDALLIALMVEQIKPGDEIITSPFTFFATVGAIVRAGAKPVFADIDPVTFNLDPAKVAEITGLAAGYKVLYLIAAGYPAESPVSETAVDGNVDYYLDAEDVLHIPKLPVDEITEWM